MKCKKIKKILQNYINNELDKKTALEINAHLKECDSCKKDYEFYKKYFKGVSKIKPVKASDDLVSKLNERIENKNSSKKFLDFISPVFRLNYKTLSFALILILAILIPINYFNSNKKINENKLNKFAKNDSAASIAGQKENPLKATETLTKKENPQSTKAIVAETAKKDFKADAGKKVILVTLLITAQNIAKKETIKSLSLDKDILSEKDSKENPIKRKETDGESKISEPFKKEIKKPEAELNSNKNQDQFSSSSAQREMQESSNSEQQVQVQKNLITIESLIKEYNGKIIKNEEDKNNNIYFEIPENKYKEFLIEVKSLGKTIINNDKKNNTVIKLYSLN